MVRDGLRGVETRLLAFIFSNRELSIFLIQGLSGDLAPQIAADDPHLQGPRVPRTPRRKPALRAPDPAV